MFDDEMPTPEPAEGAEAPNDPPEQKPAEGAEGAEAPNDPPEQKPAEGAEAPKARKLPRGIVQRPAEEADEGKGKGKGKGKAPPPVNVSHEKAKRFGKAFGKLVNAGLNTVAEMFGSPVRAEGPEGKVFSIEFPDKTGKELTASGNGSEELAAAFADLFVEVSVGEAVGYHLARCVPNIAAFDEVLKRHPFATLAVVSIAATGQFAWKVANTATVDPAIGVKHEPEGEKR